MNLDTKDRDLLKKIATHLMVRDFEGTTSKLNIAEELVKLINDHLEEK